MKVARVRIFSRTPAKVGSNLNKRRPRINAASSCGVYSNDRLKKHTATIASIAVGNFE